jgi:hypothetical protein
MALWPSSSIRDAEDFDGAGAAVGQVPMVVAAAGGQPTAFELRGYFGVVVFHGSDANVARPPGALFVNWIGSVQPANWVSPDVWDDTSGAAATAPGAPTSVTGSPGNGQVTVSWTAPSSDGGSAITDYTVQFSSNGGSTWTTFTDAVSTATTATVTGLTNGTAYVFRVAAVNAVGTSAYSTASGSVTPSATATVPGAVL